MNSRKSDNIYRMMETYNLIIVGNEIQDNLKCVKCKSLLKDALQAQCGCRFCRTCIRDMLTNGSKLCPGITEECHETSLSSANPDYSANKSIFNLIVKCPHDGCMHECRLSDMEEHLQVCPRKISECPFHELGCKQDNVFAEEISGHLYQENRSHSQILIEMIFNINKEIEILKCRDDGYLEEIEMLKRRDERSEKEIKLLKEGDEKSRKEIEILKCIDEESRKDIAVLKQMDKRSQNEIELLKQREDESVREIEMLKQTRTITNEIEMQTMRGEIKSIKDEIKLIKMLVGFVDASCEWVNHENVAKADWGWGDRTSGHFTGVEYLYNYQLISLNNGRSGGMLSIRLVIHAGPNNDQISWPFNGTVVIIISDKDRREVFRNIVRQCKIERPPNIGCSYSEPFDFSHSELIGAGMHLDRGICVSCQIMPCTGR